MLGREIGNVGSLMEVEVLVCIGAELIGGVLHQDCQYEVEQS
jgi:hypothetical protein